MLTAANKVEEVQNDRSPQRTPGPRASNGEGPGRARHSVHRQGDRSTTQPRPRRWLVDQFQPVSLKQLNAKAAMLERLDNKYVVRSAVLRAAVAELVRHFDILEINGVRNFTYETCYFDDEEKRCYFEAHQGRRRRFKVRVRKYTDSQLCFVEIKLKDKRGITVKKRLRYEIGKYGTLDPGAQAHIRAAHEELYGRTLDDAHALEPVIEIRYRRITLVAKEGGERMTIDSDLVFFGAAGRSRSADENVFIVETKSSNGNGIADKILRGLHQHPTKRCSKYCVGMAALQAVHKHNNFLQALRKLTPIETYQERVA